MTDLSRRAFMGTLGATAAAAVGVGSQVHGASDWPEATFIETNGIRMAVHEAGTGFPVVFSHGFPELAFSWRHQVKALSGAGFRAIAPDQRGYGQTESPSDVASYDIHHLCGDLVGLLDALEIERAVFCGHDWGGLVVWMMGLLHPDRVAGVIGVNTALSPRTPVAPIGMMRSMLGDDFYIVKFQEPGFADAALAKDVRNTFSMFMRRGGWMNPEEFDKLPADSPTRRLELLNMLEAGDFPGELLLSEPELNVYVRAYEASGFTGGINWYRNIDRNWEMTADLKYEIAVPCLYVGAANDVVLRPSSANGMERMVPDLEKTVIEDCGHWTQQEKPEELNRILIDWLSRHFEKS